MRDRTWRVWVCPSCDEIVMRAGVDGRCAGSLPEGTAHEDVAMRAAVVREIFESDMRDLLVRVEKGSGPSFDVELETAITALGGRLSSEREGRDA